MSAHSEQSSDRIGSAGPAASASVRIRNNAVAARIKTLPREYPDMTHPTEAYVRLVDVLALFGDEHA